MSSSDNRVNRKTGSQDTHHSSDDKKPDNVISVDQFERQKHAEHEKKRLRLSDAEDIAIRQLSGREPQVKDLDQPHPVPVAPRETAPPAGQANIVEPLNTRLGAPVPETSVSANTDSASAAHLISDAVDKALSTAYETPTDKAPRHTSPQAPVTESEANRPAASRAPTVQLSAEHGIAQQYTPIASVQHMGAATDAPDSDHDAPGSADPLATTGKTPALPQMPQDLLPEKTSAAQISPLYGNHGPAGADPFALPGNLPENLSENLADQFIPAPDAHNYVQAARDETPHDPASILTDLENAMAATLPADDQIAAQASSTDAKAASTIFGGPVAGPSDEPETGYKPYRETATLSPLEDELISDSSNEPEDFEADFEAEDDFETAAYITEEFDAGKNADDPFLAETSAVQETIEARGVSRMGLIAGAAGLIGGLGIAGGVGLVVLNPGLLGKSLPLANDDNEIARAERLVARGKTNARLPAIASQDTAQTAKSNNLSSLAALNPQDAARQASLTASNITGSASSPIPLLIGTNAVTSGVESFVAINGLPPGASLSSGLNLGSGNWLLPPAKLDGLVLNVPDQYSGTLVLTAQLLKTDARTPITQPHSFNVQVTSAPKSIEASTGGLQANTQARNITATTQQRALASLNETQGTTLKLSQLPELNDSADSDIIGALPVTGSKIPAGGRGFTAPARAPRNLSQQLPGGLQTGNIANRDNRQAALSPETALPVMSKAKVQSLIKRGDELFRLGDLASARLIYGQAASEGDAEAAVALGRTFDPVYFEKLDVQGFEPEPAKAMEWYRKASIAGSASAQDKIDKLQSWLSR